MKKIHTTFLGKKSSGLVVVVILASFFTNNGVLLRAKEESQQKSESYVTKNIDAIKEAVNKFYKRISSMVYDQKQISKMESDEVKTYQSFLSSIGDNKQYYIDMSGKDALASVIAAAKQCVKDVINAEKTSKSPTLKRQLSALERREQALNSLVQKFVNKLRQQIINLAINAFAEDIKAYLAEYFTKLGITNYQTAQTIQTKDISEKIKSIFNQNKGMRQIGLLHNMGFDIYKNGMNIIPAIENQIIGYVAQWDEKESNKETLNEKVSLLQKDIIKKYCAMIKQLQQLAGLEYSTMVFGDTIEVAPVFTEKLEALKKNVTDYAKALAKSEEIPQRVQDTIDQYLNTTQKVIIFAATKEEFDKMVNEFFAKQEAAIKRSIRI